MIKKLEIAAQHTELTPELKKYITKKIGRLDRYVSRKSRQSIRAEVRLREKGNKDKKQFACSVTIHLPKEVIEATESTINMFAAIDIVETKLQLQLKKYKDTHGGGAYHRRMFARFKKRSDVNSI